jgi:hypothetical protein
MAVQSAPPCGPHAKSIAFCSTAVGWSERHTQKSAAAPVLLLAGKKSTRHQQSSYQYQGCMDSRSIQFINTEEEESLPSLETPLRPDREWNEIELFGTIS